MSRPPAKALAHALLLLVPFGLAWRLHLAGWSREEMFATAILAGTALFWVTEALPLFATSFISIAAQMFFLANLAQWPKLGLNRGERSRTAGLPRRRGRSGAGALLQRARARTRDLEDRLDLTAYALTIALVASLGRALPVSTPPNATAHAPGEVTRRDFVTTGGYLGLAGTALVVLMFAFLR